MFLKQSQVKPAVAPFERENSRELDLPIEIEPGHENNAVNTQLPLLSKHCSGFFPECTSSNILMAILFGFYELLTLREEAADYSNRNRDPSSSPEYCLKRKLIVQYLEAESVLTNLPSFRCASDSQISTSSKNIPERVALLQDATHKPSGIDWAMF